MHSSLRFKFKRHRTPRAALRAFVAGSGSKLEDLQLVHGKELLDIDVVEESIQGQGMWGFAETFAKPPVIHYWHDGKRSEAELARFFGHEMGHCAGKPLKGVAEEHRADQYGEIAAMVLREVRRRR